MSKDSKRILFWLTIAVVIIGSLVAIMFSGKDDAQTDSQTDGKNIPEVSADEWYKGNPDSQVVLVEYSDFQCPACKSRLSSIEPLVKEFNSHIRFVYRNFPLRSIHRNAQLSAQAAEAAGLQGAFWEMHDQLFETQEDWSELPSADAKDFFIGLAEGLQLEKDQFEKDLTSSAVEKAVNKDLDGGLAAGVNSTPSFFLNGKYIEPRTQDDFRNLVRTAINEAK